MAELSTIARPYAEALFSAATAAGQAAAWQGPLQTLARVASQSDVAAVLRDPKLAAAQAVDLLTGLTPVNLPDGVRNLVQVLVENDRLATLPEISRQYDDLKHLSEGSAECLVESAFPLDDHQLGELMTALARKFPQRLQPQVRVAPELIGGVRVTVGDQVLDASVRMRLDQMRTALTA